MTIDLQHSLADLAGSVYDDALAARLTAQVGPMVGRIRRRRAARATAVGAVSMGTVAAMAVGAVALVNRGGPTPGPATEAPEPPAPVAHDGEALGCGDAVPDTLVSDPALALAGETPTTAAYGSDLMATLRWWAPSKREVRYAEARVDVAVAQGGVVVGVASDEWPVEPPASDTPLSSTETGTLGTFASRLQVEACDDDAPLEPGDYQVVATVTLTSGTGETWRASTGPRGLSIGSVEDAAATAEAEAAVQDIIAASPQVSAEQPFGTCGTVVPARGTDEPLSLELDLDSGTGMQYAPGDLVDAVTILLPTGGRTSVLADLPEMGATVVLTRDGVVVGRGAPFDDSPMLVETTTDGQAVYGTGEVLLCSLPGADAPELDLPPGIYQAYAVMPVTLQQITEADGTTHAASGTLVLRSQPVDVIVEAPRE